MHENPLLKWQVLTTSVVFYDPISLLLIAELFVLDVLADGVLCLSLSRALVLGRDLKHKKEEMAHESRIYVGNLPTSVRTKDIEDIFTKFGKVLFVDLKDKRPPYFAFVEFEDPRLTLFSIVIVQHL